MNLRFGSVCSGIEAASVAWNAIGWKAAWFSEIEKFPCELLKYRFPDVPNLGDMTTITERILSGEVEAPDLLCGGTPCQGFSLAGLRGSLSDDRSNLALCFCEIFDAIDSVRLIRGLRPAICFWENVPGVLSTTDNAFGCLLAKIVGASVPLCPSEDGWRGSGFVRGKRRVAAWRTLDAQYFDAAQRRQRVFLVASAREDFDPCKVLFERPRLSGNSQESRGEREGTSCFAESSFGQYRPSSTAGTLKAVGGVLGGGVRDVHNTVGALTACDLMKGSTSNEAVNAGLLIPT